MGVFKDIITAITGKATSKKRLEAIVDSLEIARRRTRQERSRTEKRPMNIRSINVSCNMRPFISVSEEGTSSTNVMGISASAVDCDGAVHQAGVMSVTGFGYELRVEDEMERCEWQMKVLLGAVDGGASFPLYFIESVTVNELYRKNGIGKAMMAMAIDILPGTHVLLAETAEKPWLKKFYESLGFDELFMHGGDTVMMRGPSPAPRVAVRGGTVSCG